MVRNSVVLPLCLFEIVLQISDGLKQFHTCKKLLPEIEWFRHMLGTYTLHVKDTFSF